MKVGYCESEYEAATLDLLEAEGWLRSSGDELHRKYSEAILEEDLNAFLSRRHPDFTEQERSRVVFNLRNTSSNTDYLSLRSVGQLCLNGFVFDRDDTSLPSCQVDYIDFEKPNQNIFRAVSQLTIREMGAERRPDILLYVNGIPLCIIELKNPAQRQASISSAWEQIHIRYKRDIPSLMKFCLLSVISDGGNTRLGTTCAPFEHYYAWKKVENEENAASGLGELQSLIKGALAPGRFLEIVRDFVYFPDVQEGQQQELEIVCRYPQFFAVRKLYESILKHLRSNGGDGKGGTYFGATGCGKTFTMLFLARRLIKRTSLAPTILIIVDREDLETQAGKLFETSTDFLGDEAIRSFESREDLKNELLARQSGGVFVTTVQKFCETTGLLSRRGNIICFSDEAHRSQLNLGERLEIKDGSKGEKAGAFVKLGFAQYLHDALPNATFVGFMGTPIEDTEKVDKRRRAMSRLDVILGDDDRLERMAEDIVSHYESYAAEHAGTASKAMIVSSSRPIAYRLLQKIKTLRPEWFEPKRVADESVFNTPELKAELEGYQRLPMVNMVATRGINDPKEMFDLLGDKAHRQMLDREFKKPLSNLRIAIVVDMWITGFDVPCLAVLYNDKPLQRHTLIQTISRVNRKYPGKEYGLIVDYIGIRENMQRALKQFGGKTDVTGCIDGLEVTYAAFANALQVLKDLFHGFDAREFFTEGPMARLLALQKASEFVLAQPPQGEQSFLTVFKGQVRCLKSAYGILQPSGRLSKDESAWAQFFMAVLEITDKTSCSGESLETMNRVVENMVSEALQCTGIETVLNVEGEEELFSDKFTDELNKIKLPHTKFQLLVKSLKKAIREYGRTNQLKAQRFDERLQKVVDQYNSRDNLMFANEVASKTVNSIQEVVRKRLNELTEEVLAIFRQLRKDREEFKRLGITFEEKAFYDILVDQREAHGFKYPDERCITLSRKIKELIDNSAVYADWINNDNLKADLQANLLILLYTEGYPPEWDEEVFNRVMEQVRNFKTYNN